MNLQQDKDIQHWGIDFGANEHKCRELGVTLLRKPVRVFLTVVWVQLVLCRGEMDPRIQSA
jgi:hypothetical protein